MSVLGTGNVEPRCITLEAPTEKYNGIMLLGEAPGEEEAEQGKPFVGKAGKLLDALLLEAELSRASCVITTVFHIRPPKNKVEYFFGTKEEGDPKLIGFPFREKMFLKSQYGEEIGRLFHELRKWKPKVIVVLGGTALWALTGEQKISQHVGTALTVNKHIVLPAWHPSFLIYSHVKAYNDQVVEVLKAAKEFADV